MGLFKKKGMFDKIKAGIPSSVNIPSELEKLCEWLDKNGYPISGDFALNADDGETMGYWLGFKNVSDRFGIFGSGPDGSLYSFWIDDNGDQKIVHLGSEGGELYVLAKNFVDFIKLLAIGYDEIGFADLNMTISEWNKAIEYKPDHGINTKFQDWVKKEFETTIPERGADIVDTSDNSFELWIESTMNTYSSENQ